MDELIHRMGPNKPILG